jgi:hypothetical protein
LNGGFPVLGSRGVNEFPFLSTKKAKRPTENPFLIKRKYQLLEKLIFKSINLLENVRFHVSK